MLRKNQPALQIKTEKGWEFVFCYSGNTGAVVTTKDRGKALNANHDMAFFSNKYGNSEFKAERGDCSAVSKALSHRQTQRELEIRCSSV